MSFTTNGRDQGEWVTVLNQLMTEVHLRNAERGWWNVGGYDVRPVAIENWPPREINEPFRKELSTYVVGTKLALIHSEVSEGLEAFRKNLNDDKFPDCPGLEVELIDTIIRCLDLLGACGYTFGETFVRIMNNNAKRPDHDPAERAKQGGKKF